MRNPDTSRATDAHTPDDGPDATYSSAVSRRSRRRKQAMAGVVGLLAILGAGTAAAVTRDGDGDTTPAAQTGAVAPPAQPSLSGAASATPGGAPSAGPSAARSAAPASTAAPAATATAKPRPSSLRERVATARSAAAKAGTTVRKPLPVTNGGAVAAADEVKVTESGSLKKDRAFLRVVSARQDLTGQRELAWAADEGVPVGDARCTQNFRLSANAPVSEKPTLLLCWRTSATKTVYTVAVKLDDRPSKRASVDVLDRTWASMG